MGTGSRRIVRGVSWAAAVGFAVLAVLEFAAVATLLIRIGRAQHG